MKQYLFLVDDNTKAAFEAVFPKLQFLEVQGLNLNGQNTLQMLATPVYPPVTQASVPVPPEQPAAPAEAPAEAPEA